jgi:hypothetical protein
MDAKKILSNIFGNPAQPQAQPAARSRNGRLYTANKMVAHPAPSSVAQMLGFKPAHSSRSGLRVWRGQLPTRHGKLDAVIESPYKGSYALYLLNPPSQLRGHRCIPVSGNRWAVHVHGPQINLDQFILAAEKVF